MKIILSKEIGFCFGVKKAVEIAQKVLVTDNQEVYMLGCLIHNPQVMEMFQKKGAKIAYNIQEIPENSTIITRAHGVSPSELQEAAKKRLKVINTICPYVKKVQEVAKYLATNNYFIVIFGDKKHPEIKAIMDTIYQNAEVIEQVNDLKEMKYHKKIGLISQTTKNINDYKKISFYLLEKTEELRIFNTICKATTKRQASALELSSQVDIMLVIGGKESANTSRLVEICRNQGVKTQHIERTEELDYQWFKPQYTVGITSGASTPDWVIEEVINKIREWYN